MLRIATEKANVIKELEIEDFSLRQRHTSKSESTAQKLAIAFGTVFLISFTSYKFINEGDKSKIDTATGSYMERVKE